MRSGRTRAPTIVAPTSVVGRGGQRAIPAPALLHSLSWGQATATDSTPSLSSPKGIWPSSSPCRHTTAALLAGPGAYTPCLPCCLSPSPGQACSLHSSCLQCSRRLQTGLAARHRLSCSLCPWLQLLQGMAQSRGVLAMLGVVVAMPSHRHRGVAAMGGRGEACRAPQCTGQAPMAIPLRRCGLAAQGPPIYVSISCCFCVMLLCQLKCCPGGRAPALGGGKGRGGVLL